MRLQSKIKVNVKGRVFGGEKFLNCISIRPKSAKELKKNAEEVVSFNPDMVEWRVDCFEPITDINSNNSSDMQDASKKILDSLEVLNTILKGIPILLCFRAYEEGGKAKTPWQYRLKILEACVKSGMVDMIDAEIDGDASYIKKVGELAKKNNIKMILSHHEFNSLQNEEQFLQKALEAQQKGADIAKLVYVGRDDLDSLMIAKASKKAKMNNELDIPFCSYVMGNVGLISRIMSDRYGSDFGCCALRNEILEIGFEDSAEEYYGLKKYFSKED